MPFPYLDSLAGGVYTREDSQYFIDVMVDPAIRKETDGGLIYTRKQYTRDPAHQFTTGFTALSDAHKLLLDQLWVGAGGGASIFLYQHPLTNVIYNVRFEEQYQPVYKGFGSHKVWDVTNIKMRTV